MNYFKRTTYKILSIKLVNRYLKENNTKKLQIGCGENLLEGWLNTDLTFTRKKIAFHDASRIFNFKDNSFSFIFSEHIIEHLKFNDVLNMLRECYRVLEPGGIIRIATPDLNFLINLHSEPNKLIHREYVDWASREFLKDVSTKINDKDSLTVFVFNNFFKEWGHQIIFNFSTLKALLELSGFREIIQCQLGKSDRPELCNLEHHGTVIPEKFNLLETFVLEAKK